jgi:hypothetical protein
MSKSYAPRVRNAIDYSLVRLGSTVTYNRLRAKGAWSPSSVTDIYWECPSIRAIAYGVQDRDIEQSGGRLSFGDVAFVIKSSSFTDLSGCTFISFNLGTEAFVVGEEVTGAVSGKTGIVSSFYLSSGSWTLGTATGGLYLSGATGVFVAEALSGDEGGAAKSTKTSEVVGSDTALPFVGDEIIYRGITYVAQIEGSGPNVQRPLVSEDITETTVTVWGRKKGA